MYQRKEITSDASLAELLTIETLRRLENNEPRFLPFVDVPLASRVDPQDIDNADVMGGVFAERADTILRAEYGRGKSTIAAVVKWLVRLWIAIVALVLLVETGICGHVLLAREADQTVSLEGFGWLLTLDLVMAILSVLAMLAPLIGHCRGRSESVALPTQVTGWGGPDLRQAPHVPTHQDRGSNIHRPYNNAARHRAQEPPPLLIKEDSELRGNGTRHDETQR